MYNIKKKDTYNINKEKFALNTTNRVRIIYLKNNI